MGCGREVSLPGSAAGPVLLDGHLAGIWLDGLTAGCSASAWLRLHRFVSLGAGCCQVCLHTQQPRCRASALFCLAITLGLLHPSSLPCRPAGGRACGARVCGAAPPAAVPSRGRRLCALLRRQCGRPAGMRALGGDVQRVRQGRVAGGTAARRVSTAGGQRRRPLTPRLPSYFTFCLLCFFCSRCRV